MVMYMYDRIGWIQDIAANGSGSNHCPNGPVNSGNIYINSV